MSEHSSGSWFQSLGAGAAIVAIPFIIFMFVRWVYTSKVGAAVGFVVAVLIMALVLSNPDRSSSAPKPEQTIESRADELDRMAKDIRARQLANQPLSAKN